MECWDRGQQHRQAVEPKPQSAPRAWLQSPVREAAELFVAKERHINPRLVRVALLLSGRQIQWPLRIDSASLRFSV